MFEGYHAVIACLLRPEMLPVPRLSALALLLLWPLLASCGGGGDGRRDGGGGGDADGDSDTDTDSDVCAEEVDLVGVWGVRAHLSVTVIEHPEAVVRLCPNPQQATATLFLRLEISSQEGTDVEQDLHLCAVRFPLVTGRVTDCDRAGEDIPVQIEFGEDLAAHVPTLSFPGRGTVEPDAEGCLEYRPPRPIVVLGTDFDDLDTPLPVWRPACEEGPEVCVDGFDRLEDDDGDGEFGVTLTATSELLDGELRSAFRTAPELLGRVADPDTLLGSVVPIIEYTVVDSDVALTGLPLDTRLVVASLPTLEPAPEGSRFVMLRTDRFGGDDCAAILAHENEFDL